MRLPVAATPGYMLNALHPKSCPKSKPRRPQTAALPALKFKAKTFCLRQEKRLFNFHKGFWRAQRWVIHPRSQSVRLGMPSLKAELELSLGLSLLPPDTENKANEGTERNDPCNGLPQGSFQGEGGS